MGNMGATLAGDGCCRSKLDPAQKQTSFATALGDLRAILVQEKMPFILACGTLLGQYRKNHFIPHDPDIDVQIFRSDYNVSVEAVIEGSGKFRVRQRNGDLSQSYEVMLRHVPTGVPVDIFINYPVDAQQQENREERYNGEFYHALLGGLFDRRPAEGFFKRKVTIRGLTTVQFAGYEYQVPANTEEVLREAYGADFMVPRKVTYREGLAGGFTSIMN